ncbi:hypothetical protein MNBD_GAMMA01-46 [hydrothermal vent metagenome]|uniref:Uncharacterized protein n=1 Tax=hydrothermal vent metagenome TaxID=652676 RepID=A0A3B0VRT3_9ZZZZ
MPEYGWSLLSIFMSCHDLRQSEVSNLHGLIGYNEQASFQETARLIAQIDQHKVIRQEHKELLKLMIHGSTFGKGEVTMGNIYTGNLVEYILQNIEYFDATDKEIAYIACDIDTANVAADLTDYTKSSMNVYNEMQNISNGEISAQTFFGKQQIQYFFELQKFHSKLGAQAFAQQKAKNAPKIKQLSNVIQQLDSSLTNDEIIDIYLTHAGSQL